VLDYQKLESTFSLSINRETGLINFLEYFLFSKA